MGEREPRALGGELILPAAALLFTLYYFWSIRDAPWTAKVSTYFVGGVLIGLVVLFAGAAAKALLSGEATLRIGALANPPGLRWRRLGLLVLTVGYAIALEHAGFTLSTLVFLAASMLLLGGFAVTRVAAVLSVVYALGGWLLFIAIFETRFPKGPFERLMDALLR